MTNRVHEALNGQWGNYILPFFWQHGQDEATLREYMKAIQDIGIHAVCVESRPHPDFAGPKWWQDMDIILDEAKKRKMKVWILDDCHFPTGYANGAMKDKDPSLQKWVINHLIVDLAGPDDIRIDINGLLSKTGTGFPVTENSPLSRDKELICAVLYKRKSADTQELSDESILLTDQIINGLLPISVPNGFYRLFLVYKSFNAGIFANDYINFLNHKSVKILLDTVYEPHYARYHEEFGETIAGFFSDEPGFYNCIDNVFNFNAIIGKEIMPLPWSEELEKLLYANQFHHEDFVRLWYDTSSDKDAALRYLYMDCVTRLYERNFSCQLGDWCQSHGVEYIGHILEDNNSSSRLGPSAGHYFRAMTGQHMSGIDVVSCQIMPGRTNLHTTNALFNTMSDGEFYHYALAKLGASDAHTDLKKKGRAMCEIFGNYGWAEGAELMKWLTDFMLVRGINYFVPHAFSPKAFPDPDCPPHFYAHGNNMQYPYLGHLFRYMNRVAHILNGGISKSHIGILYHGEAEWSGEAMLFQKPGRICMEYQADYDVISIDQLLSLSLSDNILKMGTLKLRCLMIPYAKRLPAALIEKIDNLCSQGFPVVFIDDLPVSSSEGIDCEKSLSKLKENAAVIPLSELHTYIKKNHLSILNFVSGNTHKDLRAYHYQGTQYECVMIMNESIHETVDEWIHFHSFMPEFEYDAYENKLHEIQRKENEMMLHLEPGESRIYLHMTDYNNLTIYPPKVSAQAKRELSGPFNVSCCRVTDRNSFKYIGEINKLTDFSTNPSFADFHGIIRYECEFLLDSKEITGNEMLYFDHATEIVSVKINGQNAGVRVGRPYRFSIGDFLLPGKNTLTIEHINTVYPYQKDNLSVNTALHALGLTGNIYIEYPVTEN